MDSGKSLSKSELISIYKSVSFEVFKERLCSDADLQEIESLVEQDSHSPLPTDTNYEKMFSNLSRQIQNQFNKNNRGRGQRGRRYMNNYNHFEREQRKNFIEDIKEFSDEKESKVASTLKRNQNVSEINSSQNAKIEYAAQSVVQNSELSNEQSQI